MTEEERRSSVCSQMVELRFAVSFPKRLRGLLGTGRDERSLLLVPCKSIHTFGMPYALDVAFVDAEGTVIAACRGVEPGRRLSCRKAVAVIERTHDSLQPWFGSGEQVVLRVHRTTSQVSIPPRPEVGARERSRCERMSGVQIEMLR